MTTSVSGPAFTYDGRTWTAPAGSYRVSTFLESYTTGGDAKGDANRDGDTTDSGVSCDAQAGTVRVDLNNNHDFSDDTPMKPYKDGFQVGYFGTDDPTTDVAERQPFVVEIRKDVTYNAAGAKADFVNIGVIESEHGTHVAGLAAANGLFGGKMDGAAPGVEIVSSRACTWSGGCTNVALTEGMADLVINRGVDIVNMSIGGLPALNDGANARALLYTRLIDTYGVQLVISAGNSGPGANTIGDPGLADKVISVGASISRETWAANYGSAVQTKYAMMPFSSRGPREDGGFTPTLTAPGAAVNSIQTWMPWAPRSRRRATTCPPVTACSRAPRWRRRRAVGVTCPRRPAGRRRGSGGCRRPRRPLPAGASAGPRLSAAQQRPHRRRHHCRSARPASPGP
ncbi:hypothetical protein SVIOM342S_05347 [Streptomyces violaceorubidus]